MLGDISVTLVAGLAAALVVIGLPVVMLVSPIRNMKRQEWFWIAITEAAAILALYGLWIYWN